MVNFRDNPGVAELSFLKAAEALAAEHIEQEIRLGNDECIEATARSASAIREAIDTDRKNRQARLPGAQSSALVINPSFDPKVRGAVAIQPR